MDANAPSASKQKAAELRSELKRLQVKLSQTSDKDIRAALQLKMDATTDELKSLEDEMGAAAEAAKAETSQAEEAPPEPATPQQIEEAEKLIRLAQVEKIRGNKAKALDLMKQAAAVAPGAAAVLEALGDDYVERRNYSQAMESYAKARAADPTNIGIERKHAEMVLHTQGATSIEDQLRMGLGGSLAGGSAEAVASAKAASLYSLLIPGAGQLVLGEIVTGAFLMISWLVCLFWMFMLRADMANLVRATAGKGSAASTVLFPLIIALALHIISFTMIRSRVKAAPAAKRRIEHPKPPMDLPFE